MKSKLLALALTAFIAATTSLSAAPALLGHKDLAGQTLDGEGAKAVLMGKKVALGNTRVVIIIVKASATQDAFLQTHVGMTTSQFQNHWRRLFMTGGGTAPKIVETEAEAAKVAATTAGAIMIAEPAQAPDLAVLTN
jgi:hypothetical protein